MDGHLIQEMSDRGSLDDTVVFTVLPKHYFMMGDNRDNSRRKPDIRSGYGAGAELIGKAQSCSTAITAVRGSGNKMPFAIRYGHWERVHHLTLRRDKETSEGEEGRYLA